ncbi:MAG: DNA nickase [Cyanobacteriota bacterium]|nr:DNA nickase [Cyanobacteriota bacterium]
MVATLDDAKRTALAEKLASMKSIQELLIANEQKLLGESDDPEIRDRLQKMLEDDRKNLGIIETAIVQYGVRAEPKEKVQRMTDQLGEMMQGSDLSLYEKVAQHELLKHGQVMSGLLVHKVAQVIGADVEIAIAPLNAVNFENRAHQEQLKAIIEVVGTRELTGQDPDQGIWAKVQDAVAALSGVVGSAVTQGSDRDDMVVQEVFALDRQKANTLMKDIEKSDNPPKIQEYFGQLYKDFKVQTEAKQQVIYPRVRPFYSESDTQKLLSQQGQLKVILDEMKVLSPTLPAFKERLAQVKGMMDEYTRHEESTMFVAIANNLNSQQQQQLATEFKEAKKQLQLKLQSES